MTRDAVVNDEILDKRQVNLWINPNTLNRPFRRRRKTLDKAKIRKSPVNTPSCPVLTMKATVSQTNQSTEILDKRQVNL